MVIRQLTKVEQERAQEAESYRTQYEKKAYHYLPVCMKKRAKRNVVVAFKNSPRAYFPDLFFENEGICLEIDGNSHKNRFRIRKDARRDRIFESNDFSMCFCFSVLVVLGFIFKDISQYVKGRVASQ